MKLIRKPLLSINGVDIHTGEVNEKAVMEEEEERKIMYSNIKQKSKNWIEKNRVGSSIYVEGFGICSI